MITEGQSGRRSAVALDPITFEVIRHKLQAVTEEQGITLQRVSGSPVVTDATDFNNGLYLADGTIVTMGPQVLFHTGTMTHVIRSIMHDFKDDPGINEGDMFLLNDPYKGAVHQPDMSIVAPIFHDGNHVAWAGSCSHQLDVGGMAFGSWCFNATEVQQESMLFPGIKLVEGGTIRKDLWNMIMGMTRLPLVLGLDLKAMIAANNVAAQRFCEIMDRYGCDVVLAVMHAELDASEQQLRARLSQLPDGIYRARDFLDHDGHANRIYKFEVAVEKRGDQLTFDFSNTSPQSPGFINCTRSGLWGAVFTALMPILAPDIRWNEGLMRAVTIKADEGLVCNAKWPAPVSGGTVSGTWLVMNVAVAALSRLAAFSPGLEREGQAVTKGHMAVLTMAGRDRDGGPFGTFLMDSLAGGGGAFIDHDGLDGSGDYCIPRPGIGNVESAEAGGPFLYLFRSFIPDTAGAGRMRGGFAAGLAVTPHDTEGIDARLFAHGIEVPNSAGLMGGYEGACGMHLFRPYDDNNSVADIFDLDSLSGDGQANVLGAKPGHVPVRRGDVLAYTFQGGGGYGDPLLREPRRVAADVASGLLTPGAARSTYGVVLSLGAVDDAATGAARHDIRRQRLNGATPARAPVSDGVRPSLRIDRGCFACSCGQGLGPATGSWKAQAVTRTVPGSDHGRYLLLHADLELREHVCPGCGTLLESEVCRKNEESLVSVQAAGADSLKFGPGPGD
jgi:N-methylhydantoinase B